MLKIAIVEDESLCVDSLKSGIDAFCAQKGESYAADVFGDAESFLAANSKPYDVVFLDVKLPGKDGISTGIELREKNESIIIIFVTTIASLAIEGYRCQALDYIIKPIKFRHFEFTMNRALHIVKKQEKKLALSGTNGNMQFVSLSDIIYIEHSNRKLLWHINGDIIESSGSLGEAEKDLEDGGFYRLDRHMLINLKHTRLQPPDKLLLDQTVFDLTKKQYVAVMNELNLYIAR